MANKRQLAILKQGVAAWNKWREENPDAKIDLRGAKLDGKDLSGANFRKADIRSASFRNATLIRTDFMMACTGSTLCRKCIYELIFNTCIFIMLLHKLLAGVVCFWIMLVILSLVAGINLKDITIVVSTVSILYVIISIYFHEKFVELYHSLHFGTDFMNSDLTDAIFNLALIKDIRLDKAVLNGTSWLKSECLQNVRCDKTILADIEVRKLLVSGRGQGLSLRGKNLQGAYLVGADLRYVDLRETDLMLANLSKSNITGAKLWGSKREDWIIDDIRCEYVYWDEAGEDRIDSFSVGESEKPRGKSSHNANEKIGGSVMGDTYNIYGGQIGAVGQSASATGNTFQQITTDLSRLHEEMQRSAKTPEQRAAAEDVAKAAQAAREQNEPAMWQHLKNAGRFALDCAKTVGTDVAAEYLKKVAGL